ncbi:flavodoxin-dependent (E)-4-hydroxy-3-methylbut-2-enyl-diphosphate synthase [bacterium]|nr:flavodoxin-dependent (E)-4-hydroxy-3-methylbut-2-enyl-diphosphate synthase [bacterium]
MEKQGLSTQRRKTRSVLVGSILLGSEHPVAVQSMTNTRTQDVAATLAQIAELEAAGCEIIRLAVPDEDAVAAFSKIRQEVSLPLVADIHFDYRLAIAALEAGADKVRINPGNIGSEERVKAVLDAAKSHGAAVRIGVNAGSLEKDLITQFGGITAEALAASALRHIAFAEKTGFVDLVLSVKASDVLLMIAATEKLAGTVDYPLHLGVTEAGTPHTGAIRSAVGLGALLSRGIGDTIRVSLTGDPVKEVKAAWHILSALHLRQRGVTLISCPTCGRTHGELAAMASAVEQALAGITRSLTVAIMGCEVNGPGEAREADLGIALGKDCALLFKKGRPAGKIAPEEVVETLVDLVRNWQDKS